MTFSANLHNVSHLSRTDLLEETQPLILVVEDDKGMRQLLHDMLVALGYRVATAVNGIDGIEKAKLYTPDLIVCDMMMPEANGQDVLVELRQNSSTAIIPFIFLTAMGSKQDVRDGMNMGADDYLVKPVNREELNKTIQARLIRNREFATQRLQNFAQQLVHLQEAERERTAAVLHEQIHQALLGLKLVINLSESASAQTRGNMMFEAQGLVEKLLKQVSGLAQDLHPSLLDHLGLIPSLIWLLERYENLDITFDYTHLEREVEPTVKTTAFRLVQEALDNVIKHAHTRQVRVEVVHHHSHLLIQVADNGAGFNLERVLQDGAGIGLLSMYQRVALLQGEIQITTSANQGTTLNIRLPLEKQTPNKWQPVPLTEVEALLRNSQQAATSARTTQKNTIVVANEDNLLRPGMRRLLERNGNFNVLGEVGLLNDVSAALETLHPNLLIINPLVAGTNRSDLLLVLAQQFPETHILVISPQREKAYVIDAFQHGAKGFIPQDASTNDLYSAVMQVAAGEMYLSPTISTEDILAQIERTQQPPTADDKLVEELTPREMEIFEMIAEGKTNNNIAVRLNISVRTVETHRANLMRKLNVNSHAELVRYAVKAGIIKVG